MNPWRFILAIGALASWACAWDNPNPNAFKPVPGNPCGNLGVVCLDSTGKESGMCCDEGETCGGGKYSVGCPAGACCDVRTPPDFATRDGGAVKMQRRP
jgi:hypothetical protein